MKELLRMRASAGRSRSSDVDSCIGNASGAFCKGVCLARHGLTYVPAFVDALAGVGKVKLHHLHDVQKDLST